MAENTPPPSLPDAPSLPPATTAQQDITLAGQRKVNLIWERTQALIALIVVVATMATAVMMVVTRIMEQIPTIFSFAFGTVVGFYFSRTNHAAIGSVGDKPNDKYTGR
jgi:hypothetical protein